MHFDLRAFNEMAFWLFMVANFICIGYRHRYGKESKWICKMMLTLSVIMSVSDFSVFFLDDRIVRAITGTIAAIVACAWLYAVIESDDDDDDEFKKDLKKAKTKIVLTARGLKVVPVTD